MASLLLVLISLALWADVKSMEAPMMPKADMGMGMEMPMDTMDMMGERTAQFHDYCIIGAGPAGLQLGYYLQKAGRDYVMYEKSNVPGSFFLRYPRHGKLISINKIATGQQNRYFNERHDWNSLISDDDSLQFKYYSQVFFPPTEPLLDYLDDYRTKLNLNVQFNTKVENLRRYKEGERDDGYNFVMNDQMGNTMHCKVAIAATGMGLANKPTFPGAEYVEDYTQFDVTQSRYKGKTVLILGKGNSAFETADEIYPVANLVHLVSRGRVRLSWNTHYVGDLRGLNNNILDTYQLKSLDGLIGMDASKMRVIKRNGKLFVTINWNGGLANDTRVTPRVKPEDQDVFTNFPLRTPYDHIISCMGWKFDNSFLHPDNHQVSHAKIFKYPGIDYDYQSKVTPDLYFAGTNTHSLDWRKSAGGFIHGFRYTARALLSIFEHRYHGVPWPSKRYDMSQMMNVIVRRLNEAAGTYQLHAFLSDIIILEGDTFKLITEFPVKLLPKFSEISGHHGSQFIVLINEFGPEFSGPEVDATGFNRVVTDGILELAHRSNFLHPVFYHYNGRLPNDAEIAELPTDSWKWALPRPHKVHHIVSDFLTIWDSPTMHILPLRRFFEEVTGKDLRMYFNGHCFQLALKYNSVPVGCKNYLHGQGLGLSLGEAADIVNYQSGFTKWDMDMNKPMCCMRDEPFTPIHQNRTTLLLMKTQLKPEQENEIKEIITKDFLDDQEEITALKFMYPNHQDPSALVEDDEVRKLWRWSRSTIARQSVDYPFQTLTEANFASALAANSHGIVNFGLPFDAGSRTVEEILIGVSMEFNKRKTGKYEPLIASVDCFDWPRLCDNLGIDQYPTVKILHMGKLKAYDGPLEKQALISAVKLSATEFPMKLNNLMEVEEFLSEDNLKMLGVESAAVAYVPTYTSDDSMAASFLDSQFGKTPIGIFASRCPHATKELFSKYGQRLGLRTSDQTSWAIVSHSMDAYLPHTITTHILPSSKTRAAQVLDEATLPIFGVLNSKTLPTYFKTGKNLIVLIGSESERMAPGHILSELAMKSTDNHVKFVYMDRPETGIIDWIQDGAQIVALEFKNNNKAYYEYHGKKSCPVGLEMWVNQFAMGSLKPTVQVMSKAWMPAAKSFDHLAYIDEDMEMKHRMERRDALASHLAQILDMDPMTMEENMRHTMMSNNTVPHAMALSTNKTEEAFRDSRLFAEIEGCINGNCAAIERTIRGGILASPSATLK